MTGKIKVFKIIYREYGDIKSMKDEKKKRI